MMLIAPDERRSPGTRLQIEMPVKARWFDGEVSGKMVESAGQTLNISPSGLLIKFDRLPEIGTMLLISVSQEEAPETEKRRGLKAFQASLKGIVLWVDERGGESAAAVELDFTGGDEAAEQMRFWMDRVYEPLAIRTALEQTPEEQSVCL